MKTFPLFCTLNRLHIKMNEHLPPLLPILSATLELQANNAFSQLFVLSSAKSSYLPLRLLSCLGT